MEENTSAGQSKEIQRIKPCPGILQFLPQLDNLFFN